MNSDQTTRWLTGIDHPAVAAEDVPSLSAWYVDTLGYEIQFDEGAAWLLRAPDGTFLEVMPRDETPRPDRTTWTPGWSHLALRVDNYERAEQALTARNVTWISQETPAVGGGRLRSFLDPDGNMLQIVERT